MSHSTPITIALTVVVVFSALTGCVSQGQYDELKFANRQCTANLEELRRDLSDSQEQRRLLQAELQGLQGQLSSREQQLQLMTEERDRYLTLADELQSLMKDMVPKTPEKVALPQELHTALEEFARQHPDIVVYDADRGIVRFASDVVFDLGSAEVSASARQTLSEFSQIVGSDAAQGFDLVVVGHTDNIRIGKPETRAKHPTNWHLSVHRAISVKDVLESDGVSPARMAVMGYGQYRPLVDNNTPENRRQNRRVEMYLVPQVGAAAATVVDIQQPVGRGPSPATMPAADVSEK